MAENGKPTVASEWLTGCAGCHMSLLDMDERIVDIVTAATLWSTPITDLKHPPEEGVTVGILEGGINNSTTEEVAKMMRARSKILIALGRLRGVRRRAGHAQRLRHPGSARSVRTWRARARSTARFRAIRTSR